MVSNPESTTLSNTTNSFCKEWNDIKSMNGVGYKGGFLLLYSERERKNL